ncbi:MAG: glycerol-3-phosphate dehydrogenase [Spirochaetia bacterium]|jgi:glycerol-3-phosphate dehydrogenase (NAD(P)+)|nr:glycerol-3-phosphate dehydrogenase [Spirochaetia bacterium]
MLKSAIIGAGLMGSAMAWPLSDNGNDVRLVGTHLDDAVIKACKERNFHPRLNRQLPEHVTPFYFSEIDKALEGCSLIVSGVNSLGIGWIAEQLSSRLKPGQAVVGITKGLESGDNGSVRLFPHIIKAALPAAIRDKLSFAAIGGPCIAGELAGRRLSFVMLGADDMVTASSLAKIFKTSYYYPTPTDDLLGLEVGVALKNAYTVAVGMAYGIMDGKGGVDAAGASMHNLAAALFAQGCSEIRLILRLLGGTDWFASSLPGAGDLYVTSMGGRTVRFGRLLGSGRKFQEAREIMAGETLESIEIIKHMSKLMPVWCQKGMINQDALPLMRTLSEIIVEGRDPLLPLESFFHF